jgi:predicted glycosyltransferase
MASLINAADVVVAMGGYNTVCEILTMRKRALLVPRVRPGQEQCIRAERMAALGLLRMLHPDQLTPATLMSALRAELEALARHERVPQLRTLQGLDRVTVAIFDLLDIEASGNGAQRDARSEPHIAPVPEVRSVA